MAKARQPIIQESGNRASLLVPRAVSEHSTEPGRQNQWFLRFREVGKEH